MPYKHHISDIFTHISFLTYNSQLINKDILSHHKYQIIVQFLTEL